MTTARKDRIRPAFTLVELLVVIGLIAILIGVTLPIIKKVRMSAYIADTQNEISQISNACNAYYSTYQAYPGPFSNYETQWGGKSFGGSMTSTGSDFGTNNEAGITTLNFTYINGSYSQITSTYFVTGAQNLVLGLMGGLRIAPASANAVAPGNIAFAPSEVGLGPMSLNTLNPSRQQSFFTAGSNYLCWCQQPTGGGQVTQTTTYTYNPAYNLTPFTDAAGNQASDAPMPVFVDRFPSPLPILYLRARTGAKGVVSDGTINDPSVSGTTITASYQYDLRDIVNYTNPAANKAATASPGCTLAPIGLPANTTPSNIHNLCSIESAGPTWLPGSVVKSGAPNPNVGPQQTTSLPDAFAYFCNKSITPTNMISQQYINYSARPRAVDQFILISAGPDGIYGTTDDITSFGDATQ
jgi:prepilin-type N-terminal cleavage/methylation domain-containing protein